MCYVKLSWFNTSEAHKQTKHIRYEQYDVMAQYKRESLEIVDQTQIPRYDSRFEPLLYVPAFTQKDFHYILKTGHPTQGASTEDLGNTILEYTTPLSKQQPLHKRQGTKPHKINLTIEGYDTKPNNNNHLSLEGYRHNLHNHLYTREITQSKERLQLLVVSTTTNQYSSQNKILIDRIDR